MNQMHVQLGKTRIWVFHSRGLSGIHLQDCGVLGNLGNRNRTPSLNWRSSRWCVTLPKAVAGPRGEVWQEVGRRQRQPKAQSEKQSKAPVICSTPLNHATSKYPTEKRPSGNTGRECWLYMMGVFLVAGDQYSQQNPLFYSSPDPPEISKRVDHQLFIDHTYPRGRGHFNM